MNERPLSRLALFSAAGQLLLLGCAWLLPSASAYELVGDHVDELALGRFGWVLTFALLVGGTGQVTLAFVLRRLTSGAWGSGVGTSLLAVSGVATVVGATFRTDRLDLPAELSSQSTGGTIHLVAVATGLLSMTVAMFVLTWTFAALERWRRPVRWLVLFPCSALPLLLAQGVSPQAGVDMQRLLLTAVLGWATAVAVLARRRIPRSVVLRGRGSDAPPRWGSDGPVSSIRPGKGVRV